MQSHQIRIPGVNAKEVFAWHTRPGAVTRLTPPAMASVSRAPSDGLRVGSRTELLITTSLLPGVRVGIPWRSVHTECRDEPPYGFVDEQELGPMRSWRHARSFTDSPIDDEIAATVREEVTWELPGVVAPLVKNRVHAMVEQLLGYRARQLGGDLRFHRDHDSPARTIVVSGASGLVGRQLCALLSGGGHEVWRLVRRAESGEREIGWDPDHGVLDADSLRRADVVIHLAGQPIGRHFSQAHKEKVITSRAVGTDLIARALAAVSDDGRDRSLICASAIGWYGTAGGDAELGEDRPAGRGFLAQVCRAWEAAADPAREAGIRTVHVRTGIVQSAGGGQLALQLPLFRAGVGGPLGSGQQWMSWISLDDLVGLYAHLALTPGLSGPINAVAPEPVRGNDYAAILARVLRRPDKVRVPVAGPAALLGHEGARELALASARVSATRAEQWGYRFRHRTLQQALRHELAR